MVTAPKLCTKTLPLPSASRLESPGGAYSVVTAPNFAAIAIGGRVVVTGAVSDFLMLTAACEELNRETK